MELGIETRDYRGTCAKHGDYESKQMFVSNQWRGAMCMACYEESAIETQKAENIERQNKYVISLLSSSGIPVRYMDSSLENYIPQNERSGKMLTSLKRYIADFKHHRDTGTSIVMSGGVGTGKTHLGASMAQEVIRKYGMKAHFTTVIKMVRRIRATYSRDSKESEEMVLDYFMNRDLLIIDEIGVQSGSDHEHNTIFEIINERYADMKPTIILSNEGIEELTKILGERIIDRFRDGGAVMNFDWESYRG